MPSGSPRPRRPTGRWPSRTTSGTPPSGRSTRRPPWSCARSRPPAGSGIAADRWVFPLVGLESSHAVSLLCRREIHAWPAMEVLGATAAARIGRPVAEVEVVEVYSCFPAAVRVQQRTLGLPTDGTPTVTGGMAFAGGPFNNAVFQSMAAVVPRLRAAPGNWAP